MANFYCDISAIGNEYQDYADTPTTWGVPQDGNGKAGPGHSAAVAIATIDCATATCAGAGSISLLGVTVSSTLTGTGNSLATAIAAAINASTTAVTATYSQAILPLNRLVYARVHPTTTTLVQIMLRIAGVDWNGMAPVYGGTWSVNPTMGAFSGGLNGPFGYYASASAVFGKSVLAWGIYSAAKSGGVTEPGANDVIHVRTRRSGTSLSVTVTGTSGVLVTALPASAYRNFLFDNAGAIWTGDAGFFKLSLIQTVSASVGTGGGTGVKAKFIATVKDGYEVVFFANAAYTSVSIWGSPGETLLEKVKLSCGDPVGNLSIHGYAYNYRHTYVDCRIVLKKPNAIISGMSGSYDYWFRMVGGTIEYVGVGSNVSGLLSIVGALSSPCDVIFEGVEVVVDGGAYSLGALLTGGSYLTNTGRNNFVVTDCIGIPNPSIGLPANTTVQPLGASFIWTDTKTGAMRLETRPFTSEYSPSASVPGIDVSNTLGALMSYRVSWEYNRFVAGMMLEVARFSLFYKDSTAIKTCNIEMLTPSAVVPTRAEIGMALTYTDASGVVRNEYVYENPLKILLGTDTALSVGIGLGSWTLNGVTGVESRKLSITTAYAVKQNTEISASILWLAPPSTGSYNVYISPEIRVS